MRSGIPTADNTRRGAWPRLVMRAHALCTLAVAVAVGGLAVVAPRWCWVAASVFCLLIVARIVLHLRRRPGIGAAAPGGATAGARTAIGTRTMVHVMAALTLCALVAGLLVARATDALIAVPVAFMALAIFGGPVWLASVGDEEAAEEAAEGGERPG